MIQSKTMFWARAMALTLLALATTSGAATAAPSDPAAPDYTGRKGTTLYVSKLGDGSDGLSWETAFPTIQQALDKIPDAQGGHRIIVRPDTYMEANLSTPHPGAAGSYNLLIGDVDGRLGSQTRGRVIIDSGDPAAGFKSYDWWSAIRATSQGWSPEHKDPTFSAIIWDRWILRNLYATGSDAGLFWDCTNRIEPFTIVVEDCVGIGRAFGGGVASCLSRPDEPIAFRRCKLWALDWWGDTAALYVRVENKAMPERPDMILEDCTMASPQCALKGGNFGFHTFMRVKASRCRFVALNFSQPAGTPTDGLIQSVEEGRYLHVDFEDCALMGYKVFGVRVKKETDKEIGYTAKGSVNAYVQFTQEVPKGMNRLGHWPAEAFDSIAPPAAPAPASAPQEDRPALANMCEVAPFVWKGRLSLLVCHRPASGGTREDYFLTVRDIETGSDSARFAIGHGLASALVSGETLRVFASRFESDNWNDVTMFSSGDLEQWSQQVVIQQETSEHLFNSSVCAGREGFVMAYETNDPTYPAFTVKFARSADLKTWSKLPEAVFGTNRYTACPTIRYSDGFYYILYLERREPRWFFETYVARSNDLLAWRQSPMNPVLTPDGIGDGVNASDADLAEFGGKTYLYYAVGDQRAWMNVKRAVYPIGLDGFFRQWFPSEGIPDPGDLEGFRRRAK